MIQATINLLVSGPKYDMAPGVESPTVQQQFLSSFMQGLFKE